MTLGEERLGRVVVVLVQTSHPGNIGAAARAMKTMGLSRLRLVAPKRFPAAEATERATGADDLLEAAERYDSLRAALADVSWAVATSARDRHLGWPTRTPEACAAEVIGRGSAGDVALVFGRERSGLTNEELDCCQALVKIPTAENYRSLNLAAAVQLLAYLVRREALSESGAVPAPGAAPSSGPDRLSGAVSGRTNDLATPEELEGLYRHFETSLTALGFYDPTQPKLMMRRLRRLFARAGIERSELNLLRGILGSAQMAAERARPPSKVDE